MANFSIRDVALTGMCVAVPSQIVDNYEHAYFSEAEKQQFVKEVGVRFRRMAPPEITTSDLGFKAAQRLIETMGIDRSEIDLLIFVSQSPDFPNIPNTAPILQQRLGLSKGTLAFDVPLGCSGFVYGMSVAGAYLQNSAFRKALLITGDTSSKMISERDKTVALLFGDAAAATLLERRPGAEPIYFCMGTDGSGHRAIIIEEGGYRNPTRKETLDYSDSGDGNLRRGCDLRLEGMDVFGFGITKAAETVSEVLSYSGLESLDYLVLHQANLRLNEIIRKKLKMPLEKVPYSLYDFGNTSSATIPVTMVSVLRDKLSTGKNNLVLCGFGVGLSWGSCMISTEDMVIPEMMEV